MEARHGTVALAGGGRFEPAAVTEVALQEIRAELTAAGLDCGCRETVERILDGVARARSAHQRLEGLRNARQKRKGIAVLLKWLAEIEEITGAEPDLGVFDEAAALFEDIAALAATGAEASRRAGAVRARE